MKAIKETLPVNDEQLEAQYPNAPSLDPADQAAYDDWATDGGNNLD